MENFPNDDNLGELLALSFRFGNRRIIDITLVS